MESQRVAVRCGSPFLPFRPSRILRFGWIAGFKAWRVWESHRRLGFFKQKTWQKMGNPLEVFVFQAFPCLKFSILGGNQCQIYGNFQGFPEKNMVHEVWVGVILHDPLICMGPWVQNQGKGASASPKGNFQQVTEHPWRLAWNIIMESWGFGSIDHYPFFSWVICRFPAVNLPGYRYITYITSLSSSNYHESSKVASCRSTENFERNPAVQTAKSMCFDRLKVGCSFPESQLGPFEDLAETSEFLSPYKGRMCTFSCHSDQGIRFM